ncbi:ABC-type transport auxiliary lipoprotein family protein [Arhodomonas aquaeolei]|uniref:ABC-type transport auxiliary lipoprotein family protein n=1 Tax=Arhodomonas aquaeolei TaxID=2369 RepID=UPI00036474FD|nr:ABC-type transport auxiliary lipoprotein family protein [Arhodomonas aquaeolei]
MPATLRTVAAACLAALMVSGCSVVQRPQTPPPRTLQLVEPAMLVPAESGPHGVLLVEPAEARAGYRDTGVVYREKPQTLDYFATARWAEPPAALLADAATDALAGAGLFHAVVAGPASVSADYRLQLELLYLEQDYRDGMPGSARLGVRARLLEGGRILASRQFSVTRIAEAAGPVPAAEAAGRATREWLTRLTRFVAAALPAARDDTGG